MFWKYDELAKTLGGLYYSQEMIVGLLIGAGLSPGSYSLNGNASNVFTMMVKQLDDQGILNDLLVQVLKTYPSNPVVTDIVNNKPQQDWHKSVYAGPKVNFSPGEYGVRFEKLIGLQSTLLPINFLNKGMEASKTVARIITPDSLGTGFLISSGGMLLTNNHVIPNDTALSDLIVQFDYERDENNLPKKSREYRIDPGFFHTSKQDDWSLVKVLDHPQDIGFLPLKEVDPKNGDYVNIIQHPGGEFKQIGLYHNVVNHVDSHRIRYFTDTLPGSSGSPVFNSKWEVVALHHSGGYFPVKDGSTILCNEGININCILGEINRLL